MVTWVRVPVPYLPSSFMLNIPVWSVSRCHMLLEFRSTKAALVVGLTRRERETGVDTRMRAYWWILQLHKNAGFDLGTWRLILTMLRSSNWRRRGRKLW